MVLPIVNVALPSALPSVPISTSKRRNSRGRRPSSLKPSGESSSIWFFTMVNVIFINKYPQTMPTVMPVHIRNVPSSVRTSNVCTPSVYLSLHPRDRRGSSRISRRARASTLAVKAAWNPVDVAGVLVFSAIPFVAVQTLADSDKGKQLQQNLEAQKPQLLAQQAADEAARARARASR